MTLNCNGIRQRRKRLICFNEIKKMKIDICLLRETHITVKEQTEWSNEWDGSLFYAEAHLMFI